MKETLEAANAAYLKSRRNNTLTEFDRGQENAMLQVCAVAHPRGADAWDSFWTWFEANPGWLGAHRAFAVWLDQELKHRNQCPVHHVPFVSNLDGVVVCAIAPCKERPRDGQHELERWWELTYARYLTIPRSIIQSMPSTWQGRLAALLSELDSTFDWRPVNGRYWVKLKDDRGRFVSDPFDEYRHVPRYTPQDVARMRGRE